jgi:Transposase IS4
MVYCLSNDANNFEVDQCHRRGDGGIVQLTRPVSIAEYNKYMGGVDLADMIRLHCDSTLMGQKRWWLKLFFYLLDVGTSNALVLFNEQLKIAAGEGGEFTKWNIVEFKLKLVEDLVGKSLDDLHRKSSVEEEAEHKCVPIPGGNRVKCAYCGLMSRESRTRYQCVVCGVPLCSMGSGKVKHDCFTEAHKTPDRIEMVLKKHQRMQMKNPNRNSK